MRDPLHEVFLSAEEEEQGRHHIDRGYREREAHLACVYLRQKNAERLLLGIAAGEERAKLDEMLDSADSRLELAYEKRRKDNHRGR